MKLRTCTTTISSRFVVKTTGQRIYFCRRLVVSGFSASYFSSSKSKLFFLVRCIPQNESVLLKGQSDESLMPLSKNLLNLQKECSGSMFRQTLSIFFVPLSVLATAFILYLISDNVQDISAFDFR